MSKAKRYEYKGQKYTYNFTSDGRVILSIYNKDEHGNVSKRKTKISTQTILEFDKQTQDDLDETAKNYIHIYHNRRFDHLDDDILPSYFLGTLQEYVNTRRYLIQLRQLRKWNTNEYSTAPNYEKALVNQWGAAMDPVPFYTITREQCMSALETIKASSSSESFSDRHANWLLNVLRQLMNYAVAHGHRKNNPLLDSKDKPCTNDETKRRLVKHRMITNTLTCDEMKLLFKEISKNYMEDGTWLAIGRMLFTGVRTAEACGGLFKDFLEMRDYKGSYYIRVMRQLRKAEALPDIVLKTQNAYRYTPLVSAFAELIIRKKRIVQARLPKGVDIEDCPIACIGDKYQKPCSSDDVNVRVKQWIDKNIKELGKNMVDTGMVNEFEDDAETVTAYTLRRNAYTMMTSLAALTEEEAAYLIGHSGNTSGRNTSVKLYRDFSSEKCLHDMLNKLNRIAYWLKLYAGDVVKMQSLTSAIQLNEKDDVTVKCTLSKGESLQIVVQAYEADDPIYIVAEANQDVLLEKSAVSGLRKNTRKVVMYTKMREHAHEVVRRTRKRAKKKATDITTSSKPLVEEVPCKEENDVLSIPNAEAVLSHETEARKVMDYDQTPQMPISASGTSDNVEPIITDDPLYLGEDFEYSIPDDEYLDMSDNEEPIITDDPMYPGEDFEYSIPDDEYLDTSDNEELDFVDNPIYSGDDFEYDPPEDRYLGMSEVEDEAAMEHPNFGTASRKRSFINRPSIILQRFGEVAVVITRKGYANRIPLVKLARHNRGGTGQYIMRVRENGKGEPVDDVATAVVAKVDDRILLLNADGRVVAVDINDVPALDWQKKGKEIETKTGIGLRKLAIPETERDFVASVIIPEQWEDESQFLVVATNSGNVKRIQWLVFKNLIEKRIAEFKIEMEEPVDLLSSASTLKITNNDHCSIMLMTDKGHVNCIFADELEPDRYVRGISMEDDEHCICVMAADYSEYNSIVTVTTKGYGKISETDRYHLNSKRKKMERWYNLGGNGITAHVCDANKGELVACCPAIFQWSDVILITARGRAIRVAVDEEKIPPQGLKSTGIAFQKTKYKTKDKSLTLDVDDCVKCLLCCEYEDDNEKMLNALCWEEYTQSEVLEWE